MTYLGDPNADILRLTTHTPGPWLVVVGLEGVAIVGDGVHICDVDDQCDEDDANARLIAAAPALENSLVQLIRLANRLGHEGDAEVIQARAVMAEALGVAGFNAVEDF